MPALQAVPGIGTTATTISLLCTCARTYTHTHLHLGHSSIGLAQTVQPRSHTRLLHWVLQGAANAVTAVQVAQRKLCSTWQGTSRVTVVLVFRLENLMQHADTSCQRSTDATFPAAALLGCSLWLADCADHICLNHAPSTAR